jgi:indolepyruvate ferredoxin oxidoreductase
LYFGYYKTLIDQVRSAEGSKPPANPNSPRPFARYAFKLMAYKDECKVARLYTNGEFLKRIKDTFDGDYKVHFHLAPPRCGHGATTKSSDQAQKWD